MVDITVRVNGATHAGSVEPRMTLSDFLRDDLDLTGTHVGCEHGACGACTVIVDGRAVRSCLMLAVQAAGSEVTTIEGLAPEGTLGPLQQAMREAVSGNICRWTGYQSIIDGVLLAARRGREA